LGGWRGLRQASMARKEPDDHDASQLADPTASPLASNGSALDEQSAYCYRYDGKPEDSMRVWRYGTGRYEGS